MVARLPRTGRPACPGSPGVAFKRRQLRLLPAEQPYFSDVNPTIGFGTPAQPFPIANDFFIYVQKMFELKITNGTGFDCHWPADILDRHGSAVPEQYHRWHHGG